LKRMLKIQISKTLQDKVRKGLPKIFHYQIENDPGGEPGDLGVIYNNNNRFLAIGLYDPFSPVRFRVLQTGKPTAISIEFFRKLFCEAVEKRKPLAKNGTTGYRLVNGEGDGFSGLVLDCYGEAAVLKLYAMCWLPHLDAILEALQSVVNFKQIVLRLSREMQDNLLSHESFSHFYDGQILEGEPLLAPVAFSENGLTFTADLVKGQKTGFFLDQRENRERVKELSKGKSVLNVFSYTGAFSVYARAGGAESVLEIDANGKALGVSRRHWQMNFGEDDASGGKELSQLEGDAFLHLEDLHRKKMQWDIVILDPPAFARNKKQIEAALKSYYRLAQAGVRLVKKNGILLAASCSKPVSSVQFFNTIVGGVKNAGFGFKECGRSEHALDHLTISPEDNYLKAIYLQIEY